MTCLICSAPSEHNVCAACIKEGIGAAQKRQDDIVQDAINYIKTGAEQLYREVDTTKGRGRGPKWME